MYNIINHIKKNSRYQCIWEIGGSYNGIPKNYPTRSEAINQLIKLGYKEMPTCNGGDDDRLIIDTKLKQFAWWENGFSPFGWDWEHFDRKIEGHNLKYWNDKSE